MARRKAAAKTLVVVESNAKATTLQKFLGSGHKVMASVGHVRDLPRSGLGVAIDQDFQPKYVVPREKSKVVSAIRKAAANATEILLATDPDREGEAIAWHLVAAAKLEGKPVRRVAFHEITETAVRTALEHPREIDQDLVDAQQARRILDRLVGYQISPLLNRRVQRGTSAGRVQSVALRMVVERDREIDAFDPQEYWTIDGLFAHPGVEQARVRAGLASADGDLEIESQTRADELSVQLRQARYRVESVRERSQQRRPAAPFTTSTLQQAASAQLGMAPRRAMSLAQQLYEGVDTGSGREGLITYMRTDSTTVSAQAQAEAREWIVGNFAADYLPESPPQYRSRARNAQEAHEAVRPTSTYRSPDEMRAYLDRDQLRVYELIWRRFVASQMSPARQRRVSASILPSRESGDLPYRFNASATETVFPGQLAVARPDRADAPEVAQAIAVLAGLSEGDPLDLLDIEAAQHFTEPLPRYTEASLIRKLEEEGIGRPSTFAPTIGTLLDREYAISDRRRLTSTELGRTVTDLLIEHFPKILDYGFTAQMEEDLDRISRGDLGWVPLLREFHGPFAETLAAAEENMKVERPPDEPVERDCPECGKPLMFKHGRYGRFIGCSGFPECRHTEQIQVGTSVTCSRCGEGELVEKRVGRGRRRGRNFWGCNRYPDCEYATWEDPRAASGPASDAGDPKQASAEGDGQAEERPSFGTIAELGAHPTSELAITVRSGRYGPYVSDGKENASIPRDTDPTSVTLDQAVELLAARQTRKRKGGGRGRRRRS